MAEYVTNWGTLFGLVLRDSGVAAQGQTPNAQMAADAKMRCQMMLSNWARRRWLVYHLIDTAHTCDGSLFYTVGVGGQFNINRPAGLKAGYMRQTVQSVPNQIDYPLILIESYEEYSQLTLKNMSAAPSWYVFYDSGWPLGKVYPWPLANSGFELHILTEAPLPLIGNLTDDIILPPEYIEPIYANSIIRTCAAFKLPVDPVIVGLAKAGMETLRTANFQVSRMSMPRAVSPAFGGGYNIFADSYGPWGRG